MKNWDTLEADLDMILGKNYTTGREGRKITQIVVHHNAGRLTAKDCWTVWTYQRQASAHYQVDAVGIVSQHVWDHDTAWHSGDWDTNLTSIGVEHANSSGTSGPLTAATLEEGAHLVAAICRRYGLGRPEWGRNVHPHSKFYSTSCPGPLAGLQRGLYMARAQHYYDTWPAVGKPPTITTDKQQGEGIMGENVERMATDWLSGVSGRPNDPRAGEGGRVPTKQEIADAKTAAESTERKIDDVAAGLARVEARFAELGERLDRLHPDQPTR